MSYQAAPPPDHGDQAPEENPSGQQRPRPQPSYPRPAGPQRPAGSPSSARYQAGSPRHAAPGQADGYPAPGAPGPGPILGQRPWNGRLGNPHPRVAHVRVHRKGGHEVVWPHDRQRGRTGFGQMVPSRPVMVYDVDLGQHQTVVTADLRSADRACAFHATLTIQWRVLDPSRVISAVVADVTEALTPELLIRAEAITRTTAITEFTAAQDMINAELAAEPVDASDPGGFSEVLETARRRGRLGAEYGLWTRVIARLEPDQAAADHLLAVTRYGWEIKEEQEKHKVNLLKEKNAQEITLDRVGLYREIVAAGDIDRFALQLANNPGDISALHSIIRKELQESRRDTIDFVTHMVDSGVIDRWEINDQVKEGLRFIQTISARVITSGSQSQDEPVVPSYQRRRRDRPPPVIPGELSGDDQAPGDENPPVTGDPR